MAILEINPEDALQVQTVKILIYGQPGVGKSSLAFTSNKVLLMDFDTGAHRSGNRTSGKVLRFENWNDVQQIMKEADTYLRPYNTIVIDTIGKCLDMLMLQIIKDNPKAGTKSGSPTISGWGDLKSSFAIWMNELTALGKDVIMIAHDKDKDKDEVTYIRPDIAGGSYAEVMKQSDFVGHLYKGERNVTQLNFSPTEKTIGKNSAKFPILDIPNFAEQPNYFGTKIAEMKERLNAISDADKKTRENIAKAKASYAAYTELAQFNETKTKLVNMTNQPKHVVSQLIIGLREAAAKFGCAFYKESGQYEMIPKAEAETPKQKPQPAVQTYDNEQHFKAPVKAPTPVVVESMDDPSDYAPVVDVNPFLD